MAKIMVTRELAETLKSLRIQNNIKATDLAMHLGKSPAYISKLEKGQIQTLKDDEFQKILEYILDDISNSNEIAETLFSSLKYKYSDEEIDQQLWFLNFDTIVRMIPIPDELIDEINQLIFDHNISRKDLLTLINKNQFLTDQEISDERIPYNEWYEDENKGSCIKIKFEESVFNDLLDKKINVAPYIYPYTILYYFFVIICDKTLDEMTNEDCNSFQNNATRILNKHKFYSIMERDKLLSSKQNETEKEEILNSFDRDNSKIINEILSEFKFLADANIVVTNDRLKLFLDNLHFDVGFMLKIISLDYNKLNEVDIENKKSFISEVEKLIDKYSTVQKSIELY